MVTTVQKPAASSIVDHLLLRSRERASAPAFTVTDPGGRVAQLTCGELLERSLQVATTLRDRGLRQGERVLLCLPTTVELLPAIYGTLLAGGVCVPIYPPVPGRGPRAWQDRARAIIRVSQPRGAVITAETRLLMAALLERHGEGLFTATVAELCRTGTSAVARIQPRDLAFIQFTSGTTRAPRGVAVTHAALLANVGALVAGMQLDSADTSVSWLPPYHDMGLVGHIFTPVACGAHQHLMAPSRFLQRPRRWLEQITRLGATQTTAPNSAYAICTRRIPAAQRAGLDLSSLRWALNGAELVQLDTLRRFADAFEPWGLRFAALRPVYGLAELTLAATLGSPGGPRVDWVDREQLDRRGEARPVAAEAAGARPILSVGPPIPGHQLSLVRADGSPCGEREIGEIRLRGPSRMAGYFNDPRATAEVLDPGGWVRTGDLGYQHGGELYVTGRLKELIIRGGRNHHPQDFEAACLELGQLRAGRVVAVGTVNVETGTEDLVLVAEVRPPACSDDPRLRRRVEQVVHQRAGVRPDRVLLVPPGTLPKTTSGKLQRTAVRASLERGRPLRPPRRALPGLSATARARAVLELAAARVQRLLGWDHT